MTSCVGLSRKQTLTASLRFSCLHHSCASSNWEKMFYIKTDAIKVGIGAALTQEAEPKTRLPVAFDSCTLKPAEHCYSTTDQKDSRCMGLKVLQIYILGISFIIVTEHAAIFAYIQRSVLKAACTSGTKTCKSIITK